MRNKTYPKGEVKKTQVVESKRKNRATLHRRGTKRGKPKKPISDLEKKKAGEKKITQKFNDWADKF